MTYLIIVLAIIVICAAFYLAAIRPNNGRQEQMQPFENCYIAHRGLFHAGDVPENSLAAFSRAVTAGYGIEFDVQLTADDQLVVFHDKTLERMCGDKRVLHEMTYDELHRFNLLGTKEKIPLLKEILDLIDGSVPLIIEIKAAGRYIQTSRLTNEMLSHYNGIYCLESFHPLVLWWYKKHNPEILRGQLATNFWKDQIKEPWWIKLVLTNLLCNGLTRPDFIAYDHRYKKQFSFALCRKLYRPVNVAWTIRNQDQLEKARDAFQIFIFDSFTPAGNAPPTGHLGK